MQFQGNLKKKNYFEGWYFKHVSHDLSKVFSFIPGISLSPDDPHSFIQIIDGVNAKTHYLPYSLEEFSWQNENSSLKVGRSVFSEDNIYLDLENDEISVKGHLTYSNIIKYPGSLFSPGIMGWYSFVPFMECKHGVISVNHSISGELLINNEKINLSGGKGYIEKDWGRSFPEAWIWIQSNNFNDPRTSFQFSVAKIPWLGKFFMGFISFLYYNNKFYLFSTYNKSELSGINYDGKTINFKISNNDATLKVTAVKKGFGELMAPSLGKMSRKIKESIDSNVMISLFDNNGELIYMDSASRAGLEIIENIFNYLK